MSALSRLLSSARKLHERTPELTNFAPWPDDLSNNNLPPNLCNVAHTLGTRALRGSRSTAHLIKALRGAATELDWRQSYSEEEIGGAFLREYAFVELFGPTGQFKSSKLRGYIGFWGPDLTYDWHDHEAEELYFTLAGQAVFSSHGASNAILGPGQTRAHATRQPHLMITLDQPYLAYALWRGAGMDGRPRMSRR